MGKYFGTDGVRGVANRELTAELAYKIGRCGGYVLTKEVAKPKVLIGLDTRVSGKMLEASLTAGLLSIGADVILLGVLSTPAVAYLTRTMGADAGVMISASHNPVEDNGIKFFGRDGFKLLDETELEIEALMDQEVDELPRPIGKELGTVKVDTEAKWMYLDYLKSTVKHRFDGMRIVLDCANGAAYELAPKLFADLGAEVITMAAEPNGLNINDHCGSTHPEHLQEEVVRQKADLGLAFDGDADRLIAVDATGEVVDGDHLLLICGESMNREGRLNGSTIVSTVMSNIGFYKAVDQFGLQSVKTAVGDRYVMEEMRKNGFNLGGEQSGHIIFLEHSTTGDGMLSGIQLVNTLKGDGKSLAEAKTMMRQYPQVLVNVRVADKSKYAGNAAIEQAVADVEKELGDNGRVLVRPSGTESLIRVMAEGPEANIVEAYVQQIVDVVQRELQ